MSHRLGAHDIIGSEHSMREGTWPAMVSLLCTFGNLSGHRLQASRIESSTVMLKALLRRWEVGDHDGFKVLHSPKPSPSENSPTFSSSHCKISARTRPQTQQPLQHTPKICSLIGTTDCRTAQTVFWLTLGLESRNCCLQIQKDASNGSQYSCNSSVKRQ